MATERKQIQIGLLKVGMFLEDVFDEKGRMLFAEHTKIETTSQIERLVQRGVKNVFINVKKGLDIESPNGETPGTPQPDPDADHADRSAAYFREIGRAVKIHKQTFETVKGTLSSIRMGKSFSALDVEKAAREIVGSIMRNPDALVSLCQIKGHDEYTYEHSLNVGVLVSSLAHEMGYSEEDILQTSMGGILHDIGKMRVPEEILNKPGKYEDWEFRIMKRHPEHGSNVLKKTSGEFSTIVKAMVSQHHERFNGSGYPMGLGGDQIHEAGLICAVADVYDALTTNRVYREAWTPQRALALIFQGCDKDYSRTIVERFTKHLGIYPVGSFVRLVNGEMGVVTRVDSGHIMTPTLTMLFDSKGALRAKPLEYDLYELHKGPDKDAYQVQISLDPKKFGVSIEEYIGKTR